MTAATRPASERAADLRARILAVVERGEFGLTAKGGYVQTNGKACGCAVGAAAVAMGKPDAASRKECTESFRWLASDLEAWALEDGFEGRPRMDHDAPAFYALGVELRSLAEKAAP